MQKNLQLLIRLQEIDSKLQALEEAKSDLPERVGNLKEEVKELEESIDNKRAQLVESQKMRRRLEGNIQLSKEKLKKYQTQLYSVTTNREYDAITSEIEATKQQIEDEEFQILELMDLEERVSREIQNEEESLRGLKEELGEVEKELNERIKIAESEGSKLLEEKENLIKEIEPHIYSSYERIRKAKGGLAVVPVTRNACGGCFKTIPPQRTLEIRKMDRVILCEVCGRILVWEDKTSE